MQGYNSKQNVWSRIQSSKGVCVRSQLCRCQNENPSIDIELRSGTSLLFIVVVAESCPDQQLAGKASVISLVWWSVVARLTAVRRAGVRIRVIKRCCFFAFTSYVHTCIYIGVWKEERNTPFSCFLSLATIITAIGKRRKYEPVIDIICLIDWLTDWLYFWSWKNQWKTSVGWSVGWPKFAGVIVLLRIGVCQNVWRCCTNNRGSVIHDWYWNLKKVHSSSI